MPYSISGAVVIVLSHVSLDVNIDFLYYQQIHDLYFSVKASGIETLEILSNSLYI